MGQGNIFSSMCQEFCSQGGGVPGQVHPLGQVQPLAGTPPRQVHPQAGTPPTLGRYTPPRQVHPSCTPPLGRYTPWQEQPPPGAVYAGRYGQQAGGMHPTGMHSCCTNATPIKRQRKDVKLDDTTLFTLIWIRMNHSISSNKQYENKRKEIHYIHVKQCIQVQKVPKCMKCIQVWLCKKCVQVW